MPVIATPTRVRMITRDEIRRWLRDYPSGYVPKTGVINSLLDGVEFSDDDIDQGIRMCTDRYNAMTPYTNLTQDMIPRAIIFYGTAAHLLTSESMRQLRNQASGQVAGVTPVGLDDKHAPYLNAAQLLLAQFDQFARGIKTQRNMEAVYGGLSSGYALINNYYVGR